MKTFLTIIITAVVAGGVAFYGGIQYTKSNAQATYQGGGFGGQGTGANGSGFNRRGGGGNGAGGAAGNFVTGQIMSSDDKSITVKLPNNAGSKIVFFSNTTHIMKSTDGATSDLTTGKNVTITGTANSDGSVTAQNIQIRPDGAGNPPPRQ